MLMSLRARLFGGFAVLTLILLATGFVGWRSLGSANGAITRLTELNADLAVGEQARSAMAAARSAVKEYLIDNADESIAAYDEAMDEHQDLLAGCDEAFQNEQRRAWLAEVTTDVATYHAGVARIRELIPERNMVRDQLMREAGLSARRELASLRSSEADGDIVRRLGEVTERLMLARYYGERASRTGDAAAADRTRTELQTLEDDLSTMKDEGLEVATAAEHVAGFSSAFERVYTLMIERNALVKEKLDIVGPRVAATWASISESLVDDGVADGAAARSATRSARAQVTMAIAVGVAAAVGLSFFLIRSVILPLNTTVERLQAVAGGGGDLTRRLDTSGTTEFAELATSVNGVLEEISGLVGDLKAPVASIDSNAEAVAASAEGSAHDASEQAGAIQEIFGAVQDTRKAAEESNEASRDAARLSQDATEAAAGGESEMASLNDVMGGIVEASREMSGVIKAIDDIAFQTNLLALNAAVEAARAGDAGKGFAVVAEEVRSLASRSAEAARETSAMIEESISRADEGGRLSASVIAAFERITGHTGDVSEQLAKIAELTGSQETGLDGIGERVSHLEEVARRSAAGAEELSAGATTTRSSCSTLVDRLEAYRVDA